MIIKQSVTVELDAKDIRIAIMRWLETDARWMKELVASADDITLWYDHDTGLFSARVVKDVKP